MATALDSRASELDSCDALLPLDREPFVVRFTEVVLIKDPDQKGGKPRFRVAQLQDLTEDDTRDREADLVRPLAQSLAGAVRRRGVEDERRQARAAAEALEHLGLVSLDELPALEGELEANLALLIRDVLLPPPYLPIPRAHPNLAFCITLEQRWEPLGYTRGELVNTVSLAPGEELVLEFHSWDKTTTKSEQELSQESEFRVAETLTERNSRTVAREVSTRLGASYQANITVPPPVGSVGDGSSLSASAQHTQGTH